MNSARFLILMASAVCFVGTASARKVDLPYMPSGQFADAPEGFMAMCKRDQALCALGATSDGPSAKAIMVTAAMAAPTGVTSLYPAMRQDAVFMTPPPLSQTYVPVAAQPLMDEGQLAAQVKHINKQVNRAVIQRTDRDAMGVDEYWTRLGTSSRLMGDCEDIAIEKRIRLMEAGFPADRLFYGVAYLRTMGLHTVLIARMADGDYVLDSLSPHILRWQALKSYTWLRHQTPGRPLEWQRMDGVINPRPFDPGQIAVLPIPLPGSPSPVTATPAAS